MLFHVRLCLKWSLSRYLSRPSLVLRYIQRYLGRNTKFYAWYQVAVPNSQSFSGRTSAYSSEHHHGKITHWGQLLLFWMHVIHTALTVPAVCPHLSMSPAVKSNDTAAHWISTNKARWSEADLMWSLLYTHSEEISKGLERNFLALHIVENDGIFYGEWLIYKVHKTLKFS